MGIYTVYPGNTDAAGSLNESLLKEDVSDLITNLFPLDTPLQQALGTQAMSSVFTEYPVDTFTSVFRNKAVVGDAVAGPALLTSAGLLAKPEGYTYTASTPQYPAKLKAVAEIQGRRFQVSGTDRAVQMYGIGDRYNYEMLKVMQNVVNDFEHAFWWSKGSVPAGADYDSDGGDVYTMRQSQGLMWWILKSGLARSKDSGGLPGICTSNTCTDGAGNAFGGSSTLGSAAGSWAYDANGVSLDQAMFKERLMGPWWQLTNRGGAGSMGFASPRIKNLFSQFALSVNGQINERTIDAAAKRVVDTVDWYETDYGVVSITMSRYLSLTGETITVANNTSTTVACDECLVFIHPEFFKIGKLRGVSYSPLSKTGDFEDGLIVGEQGLLCTNPQGGAAIVNCIA